MNRYAYVVNNPLKYIDPTGHELECSYNGDGGDCGNLDGRIFVGIERSKAWREDRIIEIAEAVWWYDTHVNESLRIAGSEDPNIIIFGVNAGISPAPTGTGPTKGFEGTVNETGELGIFTYDGTTDGFGGGGSIVPYVGLAWNVPNNQAYREEFESVTVTIAPGYGGAATFFWGPPFDPHNNAFGFSIGPVAGVEFSVSHASTYYVEHVPYHRNPY